MVNVYCAIALDMADKELREGDRLETFDNVLADSEALRRLICPGGGKYVWNERWQTMESTVYGHPGQPKPGPAAPPVLKNFAGGNLGLTFKEDGLRK